MATTAILSAIALIGCGGSQEGTSTDGATSSATAPASADEFGPIAKAASYDVGAKKVGDKAYCVVCSVQAGKAGEEEEVKDTIDYKGKTFAFCNEAEKAGFISNPAQYVTK
jgi:YHS domain-containing protein